MADPWHRQLGAGTGQQGPTRTPELVHFMLALLRSLLMAETVLLASRWHRDTLCLVFGCDKICVLGLSRVPLLESESCSVMSDSLRPHGLYSSQARVLGGQLLPSLGDLPDPGIEPESPALQADSLPSELRCVGTLKYYRWSLLFCFSFPSLFLHFRSL